MKPKFTIAEIQKMDETRKKRVDEMKDKLTAALQDRLYARSDMESALKNGDTNKYELACEREDSLSRKIERLAEAIRTLDNDTGSYTDEDVIAAWNERIRGYNEEMLRLIGDYRAAKRALLEKYMALQRKEDGTLAEMEEYSSFLKGRPNRWTTPLRDSISVYIPEFGKTGYHFFGDVLTDMDDVGVHFPLGQSNSPELNMIKSFMRL